MRRSASHSVSLNRIFCVTSLLKSTFFWQFAGGFALGAVGLLALQPADGRHQLLGHATLPHAAAMR